MKYLLFNLVLGMALAATPVAHGGWTGLYRKPDGSFVGIGKMIEFGKADVFVDYVRGETGQIFEVADGKAGVGHAIGVGSPPPVYTLERKDGKVLLDGKPLQSISITRRSFEVRNGSLTLAGEMVRTNDKPRGVVLLVHGSGEGPRQAYDIWTNFFLSRGWAVVVFDKRGSGHSTGDWHDANFDTLAQDVRSVLLWARAQPETKGVKLGLWGISQAGWIIPQVIAEDAVDFAIVQAGPATSFDEYSNQTLESELRAYGFSSEEIDRAKAYYALDVAVSLGQQPFSAIETAYKEATAAGAEWILQPPDPPNAPARRFMAAIAGFDPAPYLRKVRVPYLALFGGKDHVVPAEQSRRALETLLAEAGNTHAKIVTLENDNHLNMLAKTGVRTEYPTLNRFDPAYFETLTRFLRRMAAN